MVQTSPIHESLQSSYKMFDFVFYSLKSVNHIGSVMVSVFVDLGSNQRLFIASPLSMQH
jgi:hypothetical protein